MHLLPYSFRFKAKNRRTDRRGTKMYKMSSHLQMKSLVPKCIMFFYCELELMSIKMQTNTTKHNTKMITSYFLWVISFWYQTLGSTNKYKLVQDKYSRYSHLHGVNGARLHCQSEGVESVEAVSSFPSAIGQFHIKTFPTTWRLCTIRMRESQWSIGSVWERKPPRSQS